MGIIIAVLSLIPGRNLPDSPVKYADLAIHVGLYATWMYVICRELRLQYSGDSQRFSFGLLVLVIVIGIVIECLQEILIPGRFGSLSDGLANSAGAILIYMLNKRIYYSNK